MCGERLDANETDYNCGLVCVCVHSDEKLKLIHLHLNNIWHYIIDRLAQNHFVMSIHRIIESNEFQPMLVKSIVMLTMKLICKLYKQFCRILFSVRNFNIDNDLRTISCVGKIKVNW